MGACRPTIDDFNPRPREEGDEILYREAKEILNFNPRPREEGDVEQSRILPYRFHFNPRPREEGDNSYLAYVFSEDISIHALVKRAT